MIVNHVHTATCCACKRLFSGYKAKFFTICILLVFFSGTALATQQENTLTSDSNGVRGVVNAVKQAVIRSDITARVTLAPFRAGETFKKGAVLMKFDCQTYYSEIKVAQAAYRAAKTRYDNAMEMNKYKAAGLYEVDLAKAELAQANASIRVARSRCANCAIKAPYAGRVAETFVHVFETPNAGEPLMKIVGVGALEIRLIAPSKWLTWLKPGATFNFLVDETGTEHQASVTNIGAEVDAVSGTVPIIAQFKKPDSSVLPGMSGVAVFPEGNH